MPRRTFSPPRNDDVSEGISINKKLASFIRLARLHRPVGILLLLFPAWWGLALASPDIPKTSLLILFALGAILMRSAGCVYNDMVDKDFDAQVRRTADRPLATGELSYQEAAGFLFLLLIGAAFVLFSLPQQVIVVGFIAILLILLYPWMKRITYWPQLFLGFTFNIGLLMGWFALETTLTRVPLLFYSGAILWTLGYDTIYGFQDREDDLNIGVKSTSIAVSNVPRLFLSLVYGGALFFWGVGGAAAKLTWVYLLAWCLVYIIIFWQVLTLKIEDPQNCLKRFSSNFYIGLILFLGIVFSHYID